MSGLTVLTEWAPVEDDCACCYQYDFWKSQDSPTCLDCDGQIILTGDPSGIFRVEHLDLEIWDHEPVAEALWLKRMREGPSEALIPKVSMQYLAMSEFLASGVITCPKCGVPKPREDFPGRGIAIDVRHCRQCGSRPQRMSAHPRDSYTRHEIARRDGWECRICYRAIDRTITNPHDPGYLNIDHIIPVSSPQFPGDIRSNVQATHRWCNIRKGGYRGRRGR